MSNPYTEGRYLTDEHLPTPKQDAASRPVVEEALKDAAERGLEWVIDAANEINDKEHPVFINAMKDIKRIEDALAKPYRR